MTRAKWQLVLVIGTLGFLSWPVTARCDTLTIHNNTPELIFVSLNGEFPFIAETDVKSNDQATVDVIRLVPNRTLRVVEKTSSTERILAAVYIQRHYRTLTITRSWIGGQWHWDYNLQ
jgi:hypothetical protein